MRTTSCLPNSAPAIKSQRKNNRFSKTCYLLFSLLIVSSYSFSHRSTPAVTINNKELHNTDWNLDATVEGVQFYHSLSECNGNKVVFLKFINQNKYKVKIAWKENFATRQVMEKKEGFSGLKKLTLMPGETSQADCTIIKCKECLVLPDQVTPAYKADIVQFEYKDIIVSKNV